MYFIDETHKHNYKQLLNLYKNKEKDVQYKSNIYLAAVPYLFDLLDTGTLSTSQGPLIPLVEYDEERDRLVPSHPALTGSTRWLVEVGLSLFNGNPCDLDQTNSAEMTLIVIEAIKIRNRIVGVVAV